MPQFVITAPDGTKYRVIGPDGSTEQDALAQVQAQHSAPAAAPPVSGVTAANLKETDPAQYDPQSAEFQQQVDPSAGGGTLSIGPFDTGIKTPQFLDRMLAGAGKSFVDTGRGIGQKYAAIADAVAPRGKSLSGLITGQDNSRSAAALQGVQDSRQNDQALMNTGMGKVGNFAGGVAQALPAAFIPGANSVVGAGLIGGAYGAVQPYTSTREAVLNPVLGAAAGAGGQYVSGKIAQYAGKKLAERSAAAAQEEAQNAVRDATLKASQEAGYVIPPTTVNPSATNTMLESAAGRHGVKQLATLKNQPITNNLVKQDLGLAENEAITQGALSKIRDAAGKVYQQVKSTGTITTDSQYLDDLVKMSNIPEEVAKDFPGATTPAADKIDNLINSLTQDKFKASSAVEYTKRLRKDAAANFKLAGRSADPDALALAKAQSSAAKILEDMVGRHLDATDNPGLLQSWQEARKKIAQTYTVDAALNDATGNINAKVLAAQLDKKVPLEGGMRKAAEFAQAFGDFAGEPAKGPGVTKLDFASLMTGMATGHPIAGAAIPVGSFAARHGLLTQAAQNALARPNYAPNALGTLTLQGAQYAPNAVLPLATQTNKLVSSP